MQQVITQKEVHKITGGRTPLVPIEYEQALKSLEACLTLDEAKYWSDKADALAAWAKIAHSNKAARQSRQLKLYAYRRMGELATELRPRKYLGYEQGRSGGGLSVLKEHGFTTNTAQVMRGIALMPRTTFESAINLKTPPSPTRLYKDNGAKNPEWLIVFRNLSEARRVCRLHKPSVLAKSIDTSEATHTAKKLIQELSEWLDEFEQHLPSVEK